MNLAFQNGIRPKWNIYFFGFVFFSFGHGLNVIGRNAQQRELSKFIIKNKRKKRTKQNKAKQNIEQTNSICKAKQQYYDKKATS